MVNAQEWLDKNYPKKLRNSIKKLNISPWKQKGVNLGDQIMEENLNWGNLEGKLDLKEFVNLEYLNCDDNKLTGIDAGGLTKLKEIFCSNNQLTSDGLNILGLDELERFSGNHNFFTKIEAFSGLKKLKYLELTDNDFPEQNLSAFSKITNLESLWIGNCYRETKGNIYNRFNGSLKFLANLERLKDLEISWNNIDDGLRYLPKNLEKIWFYGSKNQYKKYGTLEKKSSRIVGKLRNFSTKESLENFLEWLKKNEGKELDLVSYREKGDGWEEEYCLNFGYSGKHLLRKWRYSLEDQYDYKGWRKDYEEQRILVERNKLYPNLAWEDSKNETLLFKEQLPIKLYNIKSGKVEKTENISNIKKYAVLSYSWGKAGASEKIDGWITDYKDKLTPNGYKSLYKSIQTCKITELGIDYLWISEICIDQNNLKEENEEVSKMRQYYNNSYVTLISINDDLLEELSSSRFPKEDKSEQLLLDWQNIARTVVDSDWFTRSWTYQEGWLSKQTIFMFDDILIDGRFLASVWAFNNPSHTRYNRYEDLREFYEHLKKIATPFGWTYCKHGYNSKDTVSLRLHEAIRETKNRKRGIPVDAVYSILGLLPYGDKVSVEYKPRICPECPNKTEIDGCQHEEKNKTSPVYDKNDVELALIEVMKVAVQNGYGEPLAWFGSGSNTKGRCWLPKVLDFSSEEVNWEEKQKNGSIDVKGGADIRYVMPKNERNDKEYLNKVFTDEGMRISGAVYKIVSCEKSINMVEEKSIIEGNLHRREIEVDIWNTKNTLRKKLALWGTRETLEKIKNDLNYLISFDEDWKSNHGESLAVLASCGSRDDFFHRIDLVRIGEGAENLLKGANIKKITIGADNDSWEIKKSKEDYYAQMEAFSEQKQPY